MKLRFFLGSLLLLPALAQAEILIGSWNIKHLGWNNDKSFAHVAQVVNNFDLLAIQELMDTSALAQLEREVEVISGEEWSSMASHDLGHSSYTEHYAFLWRNSEVAYEDSAVVFLDHGDVFSREPYSARFRDLDDDQVITVATVHVVYGDSISDRLPEIEALADYWTWLKEVAAGTPRLLLGDFNLQPDHEKWASLLSLGAVPAIVNGQTTLSTTAGEYANLYDNIWHEGKGLNISDRGILKFPELLQIEHLEARDRISDHAPVYIGINGARLGLVAAASVMTDSAGDCVDINSSTPSQLSELPHVGPSRADSIVKGRPWASSNDLTQVRGISVGRLKDVLNSGLLCGI